MGRAPGRWTAPTQEPPLHGRYRLEGRFEAPPASQTEARSPSEMMSELGIVQEGDPILRETARPFDLPAEAEDARRVIAQLSSAMSRVGAVHVFGKGMGIAAPQVGIGRAAALVRTPAGETITLIFDRGTARLVAHEIDHLNGILYADRMGPGREPIPVSEYRQGGKEWTY